MKFTPSGLVAGMRTMASAAAGSNSWVQVKTHRTIGDAVAHLKGQGMQILATHLSDNAVDFREIDYTRPDLHFDGTGENGHHAGSIGPWRIRTSSFR